MNEQEVFVHISLSGKNHLVGKLWAHDHRGKESASFQYNPDWLKSPYRFALEPQLSLHQGSFHTSPGKALFGSIGDSAPDRWGRILMRRAHPEKRTLKEIDYLLGVSDEARMGALRFSLEESGPFMNDSGNTKIPPLVDLSKLLAASDHFQHDKENADELKLLLAPGSSLGGARPKASIRLKNNQLAIAKFPRVHDEYDIVKWEALALTLAQQAGIQTAKWQLQSISDKTVLILDRFDRQEDKRIPFISAMSMLGAADNEHHSYLEIVDAIRQFGESPREDCLELYKRLIFTILISNTDDHLRNHGFLCTSSKGWRLSPLYDVNPTPTSISPRVLTTAIDYDQTNASIDTALAVAEFFMLTTEEASTLIRSIADVTSQYQQTAKKMGLNSSDVNMLKGAFEHEDLEKAKLL